MQRRDPLRSRAQDNPVRLWVAAIAGISCREKNVCSIEVVEYRGASVVTAICVCLGERKPTMSIHRGRRSIVACPYRIGGIWRPGSIRIGYINSIDRGHIAHERQ